MVRWRWLCAANCPQALGSRHSPSPRALLPPTPTSPAVAVPTLAPQPPRCRRFPRSPPPGLTSIISTDGVAISAHEGAAAEGAGAVAAQDLRGREAAGPGCLRA